MELKVLELVPHCYTWNDGAEVAKALERAFNKNERVRLSFEGVGDVPSSFVNAAFTSLLDRFTYDFIRSHLSIVNSTRQINDMIVRRFIAETTSSKKD